MHDSLRETLEREVQTSLEDYGDLIVQNLSARVEISAAAVPQALPFNAIVGRHDVMGDVSRYGADEAVLLVQKLRGLDVALHGTASAEATVEFEYSFGFDPDFRSYERDSDLDGNINDGNNVEIRNQDRVDNDVLYFVSGEVEAGHRDTVNGTGGGASPFRTDDRTDYMDEVGVLPEVSARETMYELFSVTNQVSEAPDDVALYLFSNWQLYWLETDDEIEGRNIDLP